MQGDNELVDKILSLKRERKAVILAHNYQLGEVQDREKLRLILPILLGLLERLDICERVSSLLIFAPSELYYAPRG